MQSIALRGQGAGNLGDLDGVFFHGVNADRSSFRDDIAIQVIFFS